jgi:Tol biopolymer transport system component
MNADGGGARNVTPDYFPDDFLCHAPSFSPDGGRLFFVGQWWEQNKKATNRRFRSSNS